MKAKVETITPEMAVAYLKAADDSGRNFRKRIPHVVACYAADMAAERWETNGEPIQFGMDGILLNGQHRMAAIVKSGVAVQMVVVRDVPSDAVIDSGVRRTLQQALGYYGVPNSHAVASIARLIMLYDCDSWSSHAKGHDPRMTQQSIQGYVMANKDLLVATMHLASVAKKVVRRSNLGAIIYIGSGRIDPHMCADADKFVHDIAIGDGLMRTDPVHLLRRAFLEAKKKPDAVSERLLLTAAWNRRVLGQTQSILRVSERDKVEILLAPCPTMED